MSDAQRTALPPELTSAGSARRFVTRTLADWGRDDLDDAATLLISELVTNAVLHARTEIEVVVRCDDDVVRIEVHDGSPRVPSPKRYGPHAATGRGLLLVERLAAEWGVDSKPGDGKAVWFVLDEPPSFEAVWGASGHASGFELGDLGDLGQLGGPGAGRGRLTLR